MRRVQRRRQKKISGGATASVASERRQGREVASSGKLPYVGARTYGPAEISLGEYLLTSERERFREQLSMDSGGMSLPDPLL